MGVLATQSYARTTEIYDFVVVLCAELSFRTRTDAWTSETSMGMSAKHRVLSFIVVPVITPAWSFTMKVP